MSDPESEETAVAEGRKDQPTEELVDEAGRREGIESDPPFPPDWDRYDVVGYLGGGGMGHVFKAFDPQLRRAVALKFLRSGIAGGTERFLREARAQAAIDHEHVCRVYEVGEVAGRPYIAMAFVEGAPLDQVADELGREEAVALVERAARALHAAHRTGLIHRDVKPANILVVRREDGRPVPCLVDFGLARELGVEGATLTTSISGTPAYMAPEQARGESVDRRADVYALGAVLHELLAGAPPVRATNLAAALREVVEGEPIPLRRLDATIPRDLETIVSTCLEKAPGRRYDSARALADDLRHFLDGEPIVARPLSLPERGLRLLRRRGALAAAIGVSVLALALAAAVAIGARLDGTRSADAARFFSSAIARIETEARLAVMVPRAGEVSSRERLEQAAAELAAEMDRRGRPARGAGLAALGRLALLRDEPAEARQLLEQALDNGAGHATRIDLGLALAQAWSDELAELPGIADFEVAAAERHRLERELRDPALALLRGTAGDPVTHSLLAARLALCEGRHDEAARLAHAASQHEPWRFEAFRLVGEARLEATDAALARGELEQAGVELEAARRGLDAALAIAPGDPGSRVAVCRAELLSFALASRVAIPSDAAVDAVRARCEEAHRVDPAAASGRLALAGALRAIGGNVLSRGGDPQPTIERGLAVLSAVPPGARMLRQRAGLRTLAADHAARRGEDPLALLAEAARDLDAASELAPGSPDIANSLGVARYRAAEWLAGRGRDGRRELAASIEAFARTTRQAPRSAPAHSNLGNALVLLAEARRSRGEDPLRPLEEAVAAFDAALALDPSRPAFHNNRGNAFLTRAEILHERGEDPRPPLAEAIMSYQGALSRREGYATALHNLAWAGRLAAEAALARDEDASADLETALEAIETAIALDPGDATSHALAARLLVLRAWSEHTPEPLPAAAAALSRGRALDAGLPALALAEGELHLADSALGAHSPAQRAALREQARAAIERALDLDPSLAPAQIPAPSAVPATASAPAPVSAA